jgi:hypothetical protein
MVRITAEIREIQQVLVSGIGFPFAGMVESDWDTVADFVLKKGALRVLFSSLSIYAEGRSRGSLGDCYGD